MLEIRKFAHVSGYAFCLGLSVPYTGMLCGLSSAGVIGAVSISGGRCVSGSVLTTFREQLAHGGPLTVTHPDVTRFFMTVEEAVQLVIQAAALGADAQVLVLDMGEPVKIAEVARRLAEANHRPIEIVFTGLRPGEKLHEELFGAGEIGLPSAHPLIRYVDAPPLDPGYIGELDPAGPDHELRRQLADLCEIDVTASFPVTMSQPLGVSTGD